MHLFRQIISRQGETRDKIEKWITDKARRRKAHVIARLQDGPREPCLLLFTPWCMSLQH